MTVRLACVLLLLNLLAGCGSYLPAKVPFLSPPAEDEEAKISREFRRQAKKTLAFVRNPEVERYVDQIGRRLLSVMGPQPFDYRFFVVEDPQLNAFAVPGGSIYIYTGLINRLGRTDELAGVMSHEIIHVKARHMARISGPDPVSLLALLGIFLGGSGSQAQAAGALGQALAATRQLSYSRQLEQEADNLGVRYMAEAGYDPAAALAFLKLIDQERVLNPVDIPPYMMTHPLTRERIGSVEAAVRSLEQERPRSSQQQDPIRRIQLLARLESRQTDSVLAEYERLASANPGKAEFIHMLGLIFHYQGNWSKARESYERAKALDPKSLWIDRDLGRLYTQVGEFRLAHDALERALELEPKESLTYVYRGELFEKEANLSEAVSAYLRAHQLAPSWSEPAYRLGVVYGKMDRLGDAYHYLGRSELLQDEYEKAIANLDRALKIFGVNSPRGQVVKEEMEAIRAMIK